MGTLFLVVAEPTELPARDPSRVRPVEVNVRQAKPPERTPASASSVVATDVRRVAGDQPVRRARRSLQDHDDVEETDRTDREAREGDGSVVNGEFEGGSLERGHSIVTSNAGGDESGDDEASESDD